jgi:uncharacterized protein
MEKRPFDKEHVLHLLKHYLPGQAALKDFVHHNSLHAFQDLNFYKGIFKASRIFGIQVTFNLNEYRKLYSQGRIKPAILDSVIIRRKGEKCLEEFRHKLLEGQYNHDRNEMTGQIRSFWKNSYKIDLDNRVYPLLFRILCSYIDQGIALWHFPFEDKGLINALRILEKNSMISFFKSNRVKELLMDLNLSMKTLLKILVGNEAYYEQYILDQQFAHQGWSGIAAAIESNPDTLLYQKKIHLEDVILLELLLEIDEMDQSFGKEWKSLSDFIDVPPQDYFADIETNELEEVLALWQDAFEWDYYDEVLGAVGYLSKNKLLKKKEPRSFQAIFCIDDRECSIRRHLEDTDKNCETLGAPGYFGAAIYFQPFGGKFYEKNCPVPAQPKHLIKELQVTEKRKHELLHTKNSHRFIQGILISLSLGLWASVRMVRDLFRPKMGPDISDAFKHMNINGKLTIENKDLNDIENGLQVGYTIPEMAEVVEPLLKGIGLINNFSSLIYLMAHGSSSANNPHHGAHDCGACSGRPGSVNARVFAFMANHVEVRAILTKNGLDIPVGTQFLGGMHDTASDEIAFYDQEILTAENQKRHTENLLIWEQALDLNAMERSRRFSSIDISKDLKHVRKAIKRRSVSYFEPRPELGHGTNALCHVGSRERIKGLFFDRRAFLNSYDHSTDPDGEILAQVLGPLPVVCGGINLEYYFSRMDIEKMGAGTKLPHNVMGLIGVANSSDGDLRPGLPLQMIENHDPVRLLLMIEHKPEIVMKVISNSPEMYNWFLKEWIHLVVISPEDNELYHLDDGKFKLYQPIWNKPNHSSDLLKLIKDGPEMETNHILDATKENIPVHLYDH